MDSTSRGEVPSQTQRASEIMHLSRFHVNVYFGRCVRLMFPPVKHLEKRLKRTLFFFPPPSLWKDGEYRRQQNKPEPHDCLSAFTRGLFIFFHVLGEAALRVWETHVYYPQVEFILDSASVHWTITHQFSHIRLLHRRLPIEKNTSTHFFFQKFPNHIPLFLCVWVCERQTSNENQPLVFCQVPLS